LLILATTWSQDIARQSREQNLVLKPVFKGIYYYLEKDSTNEACCDNIYYLFDVKVINQSDSIAEFIVFNCTVAENIVTDTIGLNHEHTFEIRSANRVDSTENCCY
jgi:hypothetical protein